MKKISQYIFAAIILVIVGSSCSKEAKINSRRLILANDGIPYKLMEIYSDSTMTWDVWPEQIPASITFRDADKKSEYATGGYSFPFPLSFLGPEEGSFQYTCPEHGKLEIVNSDQYALLKTGTYDYTAPVNNTIIIDVNDDVRLKFTAK